MVSSLRLVPRVLTIEVLHTQLCCTCCIDLTQVEVLLEHGVDCEKRDQDGWTALLVRALHRASCSMMTVQCCAQHEREWTCAPAEIHSNRPSANSYLRLSCRCDPCSLLQLMVQNTQLAASNCSSSTGRRLVSVVAGGCCSLHFHVRVHHVNLIIKLFLHGLDCADAVDNEFDMTAWLWACDHGRSACLQPLIDAGPSAPPLLARPLCCCSRLARAGLSLALPPSISFLASFRSRHRRPACHHVRQPALLWH